MEGNGHKDLRDIIFAADDIARERVDVPEWGVEVEVRSMSALERARAMREWTAEDGEAIDIERFYPTILVHTVFDPSTGERVFSEEDTERLNTKSSQVLERLARVGTRLSGLDKKAVDDAGEGS